MKHPLIIPHQTAHGLCPVNGIRDLIEWRTGHNWSNEFLFGLALGGGFAYLRINVADPPRQVYWGNASPRQHKYLAELLEADYGELENRSFKFTWQKAQESIADGTPVVIGPLDMFYLPFYEGIYHERHIPIHYLLLVGSDDQNALVYDTGHSDLQVLPLNELELAWDVNVPGMGKRNRFVSIRIPENTRAPELLIRRSISDECELMLNPPISMLGIRAMEKVGREIANWPEELGNQTAAHCLRQVHEYLNSPPDVFGNHLTAGRDIYITFLEEASAIAGLDVNEAIELFRKAMMVIPVIAEAIRRGDLLEAAAGFDNIAGIEKLAFSSLRSKIEL